MARPDPAAGSGRGVFGAGPLQVPVEQPSATVAGEQLAFAELVPHLGAYAHAAANALLVVDARNPGAAAGRDAVKRVEPLGLDRLAQSFPLGVQGRTVPSLTPAETRQRARESIESGGQLLNLCTGCSQFRFLSFGPLKACEFFVFEPLGFGFGEVNFVFDCFGLGGCGDGVLLGAIPSGLLTVATDVSFEACTQ